MLPVVRISHQLEGRTRFRVEHRSEQGEAFFRRVARELAKLPGIETLDINPLTGSIVVHHKLSLAQLLGYARDHHLFETSNGPLAHEAHEQTALARQRYVPLRASERMTLSETVLMDRDVSEPREHSEETREAVSGIGAMVLLGAGLYQAMRGDVLPAALPLVLQAMQVMRRKRPPVSLAE